ncbi:CshA/CshB family fibrillar adhesin-related protein [Rhodanobacter sp. IGA1.0]|uniref:CshA/CshB family fibrillar adhesin-related protein n=1 Tax=Rhodanobacter sp. IGA1.0 TaxID=3158582 RepID=A0AAU7QM42_9GAMM
MTLRPASMTDRPLPEKPSVMRSQAALMRSLQKLGLALLLLCGWLLAAPAMAASCGPATGQGSAPADYSTYCWLDFSTYNDATARSSAGQNFVFNLPGGATLSFNVKASGTNMAAVASPSWSGAAFGYAAFNGIPGRPVLYGTGTGTSNFSFTNIVLSVNGATNVPYALVAADGESSNSGESLKFTTNGNPWTQLAQMSNGGAIYPTLTGVGTGTVTETGVDGTVGSYAFATTGSPTTITTTMVNGGLQGALFGVKFYAADLIITKSHTGDFIAGGTGSYNLLVHNNGPDAAQGVTTVTDTLPAGLTYASASGSGWSCAGAGQLVTCTSSNTVASGANLPAITLNVNVAASAAASISNTATVSNANYNYNTSNDSSTDPTTIIRSDLSTSTKTVLDTNGGDTNPGDTLRYTITLTNSTAATATGVSVNDDMPADVGGLNVISTPSGSTNSSTVSGGTNGTGKVSVSGISVPANGSVTIVYEVNVSGGAGSTIDNTATINNPNGTGGNPAAPTVTVSQSQVAATGNKVLYVAYDGSDINDGSMSRTLQLQNNNGNTLTSRNGSKSWVLTPAIATGKSLVLSAGTIVVQMDMARSGTSGTRTVRAQLFDGVNSVGLATTTFNVNTPTQQTLSITLNSPVTISAGHTLTLVLTNTTTTSNRSIIVYPYRNTRGTISFDTTTVINVDSVNIYSAAYGSTATKTTYGPGDTVYVRAVISDPFGSYDVNHATITLTDPNGAAVTTNAGMTQVADSGAATRTYEYSYTLPNNAPTGYWTASVTGYEGTENTVQHTANAAFNVGVPNLLVMKSVSVISDPVEGTTKPKSLPGAVMQYQITVSNNGAGPADNNSLVITDPIPANSKFVLGSVAFTDGTPSSGLTFAPANVTYSGVGSAGPWTYTPANDGSGADAGVKALRIAPQGIMAGKSGATAPNFSVTFRVIIL